VTPTLTTGLGATYSLQGHYDEAIESARQCQRIAPDRLASFGNLAAYLVALNRFSEARQTIQEAHARKLESYIVHTDLYLMSFLVRDSSGMQEEQQWFASRPDVADNGSSLASDTEAYTGHLAKARGLIRQSVNEAMQADSKEDAAIWWENAALREAGFGNFSQAGEDAAAGLKVAPASQGVTVEAALAYAITGDNVKAQSLAQDLNKRYPLHTQTQNLWLPAIQAQLSLNRKQADAAINQLHSALPPMEYASIPFVNNISCLYHSYIRGEAYLAAGQGTAAAVEFQKLLDHSGVVWNCWTGALAHLGVARANALQAKTSHGADADAARVRALAAYKDFLTLWKDADPDIPLYRQAKAEYTRLQ
jgi:tetratricopeptide (TPR) repeat protein